MEQPRAPGFADIEALRSPLVEAIRVLARASESPGDWSDVFAVFRDIQREARVIGALSVEGQKLAGEMAVVAGWTGWSYGRDGMSVEDGRISDVVYSG
jgi:hypothetical protein